MEDNKTVNARKKPTYEELEAAISMRHIVYPTKNLEDLEYLWINYNNQYRKLQREADWKCEELFGMNCGLKAN